MAKFFPQELGRLLAPLILDHLVCVAVAHEEGGVLVDVLGLFCYLLHLSAHHKIAAQANDTGQFVGCCDACEDRHCAAL